MAISIAFIIVASLLLGSLLAFFEIPPLVGMLALGIGLNLINWIDSSLLAIGTDLRMIALIIILLRAGFELSFDTLKRVGRSAILLSFLPALFEAPLRANPPSTDLLRKRPPWMCPWRSLSSSRCPDDG